MATDFNIPRPFEGPFEVQNCIRDFVNDVRDVYQIILIDCPPNLHMASWASLVASDFIIVPLAPEDYSSQGLVDVLESIEMPEASMNPQLSLLGFLLTMVAPRRTLHQLYEERLKGAVRGICLHFARASER